MTPYEEFRRLIRDLNLDVQRELQAIWRSSNGDPAAIAELLGELVQEYGSAAAAAAADWYDELRADEGVRAGFLASVPEPPEPGTSALVHWALGEANSEAAFQTLVAGGIQKRIANYSRDTVTLNTAADPRSRGWMRIGSGGCDFCAMLIGRGAVYTKATADFASHDHCDCSAAPVWNQKQVRSVQSQFVPSARRRSDETKEADRDRVKAWIADNL